MVGRVDKAEALKALPRERIGKGGARTSRRQGLVPAIVYGGKEPPLPLCVDGRQLNKLLRHEGFLNHPTDILLDGKTLHVLPKDVQYHVVTDAPLHVDFLRVTEKTRVNVSVAVRFIHEERSPGIKNGGVLNVIRHEIDIVCAVANIPASFEVDLEGLAIGDSVHISHITMPKGVESVIQDRDFTIATIVAPTKAVETTAVADDTEGEGDSSSDGTDKEA
ncbi:MAG: 50S ribosomal protein L25/general stress protein Ctc [Alphaproteobacteria bacterium GM7ARS4]|nr:50S ribosomal protein L25/general stress protein Ctc [Alphaproteobacteria bacterium GM7ARS4]